MAYLGLALVILQRRYADSIRVDIDALYKRVLSSNKKRMVMHFTLTFILNYCPVFFFLVASQFVGDFNLGLMTVWHTGFFEYAFIVPVIAIKYTFLETVLSQMTTRMVFFVLSRVGLT